MVKDAVIVENNGDFEVRCAGCGKLLFKFERIKNVDKSAQTVIIVSRCTRSNCKTDNRICF